MVSQQSKERLSLAKSVSLIGLIKELGYDKFLEDMQKEAEQEVALRKGRTIKTK